MYPYLFTLRETNRLVTALAFAETKVFIFRPELSNKFISDTVRGGLDIKMD
jgi:hypothetical protein